MKILPVGAELFHADKGTDMKKLIVTLRNFANALKNYFQMPRVYVTRLISTKLSLPLVNIRDWQDSVCQLQQLL
jgi:hypothetical protein